MPDNENLAADLVQATKRLVAASVRGLAKRMDEWEARLASIPAGQKGDKGDAGESVRGEKGDAGKDADPEVLKQMVVEAVAAMPKPADGKDGAQGERGQAGESIKGDAGAPGKDGADADAEAIYNQLRAELVKEVAALPTPANGKDGKDGASIHPDTVALMVRDAVEKAVAGIPRAKDGSDGAAGRDAAEMVMLPGIDETRSYAAGTWASHAGGLIRAARATDPVTDGLTKAGWVVMVDGVSAIVVTQGDDPREMSVAAMLTSGTKAVSAFTVPMVLDKGVWREGEYEKGDGVSWDGSFWIAQKKTSEKPGASDAFRLSTKRGRDGKDGKSFDTPPSVSPVVRVK